ncbi:NAD(P)H-binding protein [Actinosynnema sp. CS-041913]|uniref:NAD(P)H-binding protein n=1 Tax=Actinosynnema sp. CS-041913 TaxID=3239917 RepID=UPI003D8E9260
MTTPILVLGGTGKVGRRVVSRLRARRTPVRVPTRVGSTPFDWTDDTTWTPVLDGVGSVFVVPLDGRQLTGPFLARARELGVRRVVLLSGRGVDVPGYGPPDSPLAATPSSGEAALRALDVEWTILRPAWFAQNFSEGFFRDAVGAGELRLPAGDGAASFVDADDIADVAVAALTGPGHAGRTYELSGPEALTMAEAAATIFAATGRRLRYVALSPQEFTAELTASGWSEADAEDYATVIALIRDGLDSHLSDGVHQALGRPPRDFATFAAAATWPDGR